MIIAISLVCINIQLFVQPRCLDGRHPRWERQEVRSPGGLQPASYSTDVPELQCWISSYTAREASMISQSPWKALDGPSTYSPDWVPKLTDPASDWPINDRGACSLAALARHKASAIGPPVRFLCSQDRGRKQAPSGIPRSVVIS